MIWWPSVVPTLQYGLITLRPSEEKDIENIYNACQDPLISHFTTVPANYTIEHAKAFVRERDPESLTERRELRFVIDYGTGSDKEFAGVISFHSLDFTNEVAEIGYWIAAPMRNKKIGATASRILTNFGFESMGWRRIEALVDHDNIASQKLLSSIGFNHEGLMRAKVIRGNGDVIDMDLYSVLSSEWSGLN
ncbi:unannotated protein [freshwater metagenome]|uniref:Unannotated protein n=1 Tax=freshwater metagenome TaxID=449393 RepID=A0A6J7XVW4_9ZZZZ|nr:GNAT family N-acetyltransferase [Actinomycetota bacterium]